MACWLSSLTETKSDLAPHHINSPDRLFGIDRIEAVDQPSFGSFAVGLLATESGLSVLAQINMPHAWQSRLCVQALPHHAAYRESSSRSRRHQIVASSRTYGTCFHQLQPDHSIAICTDNQANLPKLTVELCTDIVWSLGNNTFAGGMGKTAP